jgi:hypothetical protein
MYGNSRYGSTNSQQIATQTKAAYDNYDRIKSFEDVGYFLVNYVVDGGVVTKNVLRSNYIDITEIHVNLDNDFVVRAATSLEVSIPNATYYLDFKDGDFTFGTSHPAGTVDVDYLQVATVTTDSNATVATITDNAAPRGGFRLKPGYMYPEIEEIQEEIMPYLPNGIDDTENIQNLLDTKGVVRLAQGTYICGPILMTANMHIYGDGVGRTILKLKDESNSGFIKMQNATYSSITDLTIDGNKENNPFFKREIPELYDSLDMILVEVEPGYEASSLGLELTNILIINSRNNGLNLNSKYYNWVVNVRNIQILECDGYGFKNATTDNIFSNFYISNCELAGAWIGGSHNKYVNFKIDGSGVVNDNPYPYPSDGANIILSSCDASQFVNFDIQSAHYVGAKIVNSHNIEFSSSFDSNGLSTVSGIGMIVSNSSKVVGNLIFTDVMSRQPTDIIIEETSSDISFNSETINPSKITNNGIRAGITSLTRFNNELMQFIAKNILLKAGNFEVDTNGDGAADGWSIIGGGAFTKSLNSEEKVYGLKSQKVTFGTGGSVQRDYDNTFIQKDRYYLYAAYFYLHTFNSTAYGNPTVYVFELSGNTGGTFVNQGIKTTTLNVWQRTGVKFTGFDGVTISNLRFSGEDLSMSIDGALLFEILPSDYNLSIDALLDKYHYKE